MEARKEHRRTISHKADGDSRYIFVKPSDEGREIIITTQVYDIPDPGVARFSTPTARGIPRKRAAPTPYWLLDEIAIIQPYDKAVAAEEFQV
jgi:hypothetical protein